MHADHSRLLVAGLWPRVDLVEGEAMKKIQMTFVLVLLSGCVGLEGHATTPTTEQSCVEMCREYDDAYLVEYALGMVFSGTTAAAGTSGVLSATLADEQGADIALAATSAASGIATVVLWWLAGESEERWAECKAECALTFTTTAEAVP
jgi:hypothetical protein